MKLAGQGDPEPNRRHERGYAMAALLVGMGIMAILMGAALPSWTHMAQREKEEEYLFRARQYARAIRMYQDKMQVANVPAPSVDFLIEQRFLRKKYIDPLSGEDFVLIQAPVGAPPGQVGAPPQPQPPSAGQGTQGARTGGFIGVTSKRKKAAIKLFKGQETTYDQWAMTFMDVPSPMGKGVPGAAGATNPAGGTGFQPVNPGAFGGGGAPPGSMGGGFSPAGPNQPTPQFPGGTGFGQPTQPAPGGSPFGQRPAPGQPVQKFPPPPNTTGMKPFQPVPAKPPF